MPLTVLVEYGYGTDLTAIMGPSNEISRQKRKIIGSKTQKNYYFGMTTTPTTFTEFCRTQMTARRADLTIFTAFDCFFLLSTFPPFVLER